MELHFYSVQKAVEIDGKRLVRLRTRGEKENGREPGVSTPARRMP